MGKLITVTGNSGVGKSTFVTLLSHKGSFTSFLEITEIRPFLQKFKDDNKKFCLANQVDFLLLQAEEAVYTREHDITGVQDGGLDESFHVFTKRFHQKGYLDDDEYKLCARLYLALRQYAPVPDLIIHLTAPLSVITERMAKRGRQIDIEGSKDLAALEKLIENWLADNGTVPIIHLDTTTTDATYSTVIDGLVQEVKTRLNVWDG